MAKIFNRGIVADDYFDNAGNRVYPVVKSGATVTAKTADYTVLATDLNKVFSNAGAGGTVVFTLPAVRNSINAALKFPLLAAQVVRLLPQSGEAVDLNGSAVVTKYLNVAGVIGNYVDVYCDGVKWIVVGYSGVVTKEA
jgi:hypothetical protein